MDINTDRIVAGVDGSDSSVAALRYAARIAAALEAPLEAVTAWTYPPFTAAELVIEWRPEEGAKQILDESVQSAFGDAPPDGLTRTVIAGPAARTLIRLSETSEMLVLGSRGHGGFTGLLLGSVSAACAEHAHCPVLIVRTTRDTRAVQPATSSEPSTPA